MWPKYASAFVSCRADRKKILKPINKRKQNQENREKKVLRISEILVPVTY